MRIILFSAVMALSLVAGAQAAATATDRTTLIFDIDQGFGNGVVVNNDQFEPAWYFLKLPRGTFEARDCTTDPQWSDRGKPTPDFDKLAAAPMREPGERPMIDVTKFGAKPNDGKDDTQAVNAALAECAKQTPATLFFPKGRYDFTADPANRSTLLSVNNIDGLTIDGGGSEFVVDGLAAFMSFDGSKDIRVKNFSLDWKRPPFSFGKVEAVEGNHFDVKVEDRYPVSGGEPVGAFMDYDPKTKLPMRHGLDEYYTAQSTELLRPQLLRVNLNHPATIKPGVNVLLRHQVYGYNALTFQKCEDVRVENVNVYTTPGMALIGWACTNFDIKRLNVVPRPKSGRPMSATADAVHLMGTKGHINMTDCTFDGMGDDAANIGAGLYLTIKEKVDDRTVLAAHNLGLSHPPDPGDTMEMFHQEDMLVYGAARVESVEQSAEGGIARIAFVEPLPAGMKVGDLIGNASGVAKTRIANCTVRNNRARGFLIATRDAVIEKCRFRNSTSAGVWVLSETAFFCEAITARDVIVRDCVFDNCNYSGPTADGVLCSFVILSEWRKASKPGILGNILFENNTIRRADNSAIVVSGTDRITIRNNTIEKSCEDPTLETGHSAIYVSSSRNITIEGNIIDPKKQGKGFKQAVTLGPGNETDTLRVPDPAVEGR